MAYRITLHAAIYAINNTSNVIRCLRLRHYAKIIIVIFDRYGGIAFLPCELNWIALDFCCETMWFLTD